MLMLKIFPMAMVVTIVIIGEFNDEGDSSDGHVGIGQDGFGYMPMLKTIMPMLKTIATMMGNGSKT